LTWSNDKLSWINHLSTLSLILDALIVEFLNLLLYDSKFDKLLVSIRYVSKFEFRNKLNLGWEISVLARR
jgi:hypothetical protein